MRSTPKDTRGNTQGFFYRTGDARGDRPPCTDLLRQAREALTAAPLGKWTILAEWAHHPSYDRTADHGGATGCPRSTSMST